MEITCIIPAYDYTEGVLNLSHWIKETFNILDIKYHVIVHNDNEKLTNDPVYKIISQYSDFEIIHVVKNTCDLKIPLKIASNYAIENNHDAVLVLESDAVPNIETFKKMLEVYNDPILKPLASVSPIYKWKNQICYPSNKRWFDVHDSLKHIYNSAGTVVDVGLPGVPFLFSLWKPDILNMINDDMPNMVGLDSYFGKKIAEKGYHHLRLLNYHVEHINGGKRSWMNNENFNKNQNMLKNQNIIETVPSRTIAPPPRKIITYQKDGKAMKSQPIMGNNFNTRSILEIENNLSIFNKDIIDHRNKKIAVILHLYYIDLWNEILTYLKNIEYDFDLYVTLIDNNNYKEIISKKNEILSRYKNAKIYCIDNKGLDIGGFLYVMDKIKNLGLEYDYILKIHSKKSIHSASVQVGNTWRTELYNSLMGSKKIVNGIFNILSNDEIGMVGSSNWYITAQGNRDSALGKNYSYMKKLSDDMKLTYPLDKIEFIGGTMFWSNFKSLMKVFKGIDILQIRNILELGAVTDHRNPTFTHSMERILGLIILNDNKKILGI